MLIEIPEVVTRDIEKNDILCVIITKDRIPEVINLIESLFNQIYQDGENVSVNIGIADTGSNFDSRLKWKKYWQNLSDEKKSRIAKFDGLSYHFASNNNQVVEKLICPQYTPKYLLFLNNDVDIIQNNALAQMLQCFELYPNVGTVGVQSLQNNGLIQHQAIECIRTGKDQFGFTHTGINTYAYDYLPRICFGSSAFMMMTPIENFYRFGKFNTQTKSCLEDAIYAIDNLCNGFLNLVCNSVITYHNEGSTRKKDLKYQQMLQEDLQYVNAYLNYRGHDGKTRAEILAPFVKQGNYVR